MRTMQWKRKLYRLLVISMVLAGSVMETAAAPGYEEVATSKSAVKKVGKYGMTPVTADMIADGEYDVNVESSSSFFRIEKARLTVQDGKMQVLMYMYSSSYECIYPGTAQEAAAAPYEAYLQLDKENGWPTFMMPVEALNKPIDCAAFSVKKKKWYDRKLLIDAADLPMEAVHVELPDYKLIDRAVEAYLEEHPEAAMQSEENQTMPLDGEGKEPQAAPTEEADGGYSIEVSLVGGSGRASVSSPTWLYVRDGKAYAKLLWSSSYYDYMLIDGYRYDNETTDGSNSTFTIPITKFDDPIEVIADTTAMGDPVEIAYTLTFYADTIGSKGLIPQEAAYKVFSIAIVLIAGGGILNYFLKKKRKH